MGSYQANLPDLVVASSALTATSNIVTGLDDATSITITAPATLSNTHHVQVHASPDAATSSAGWATATNASGSVVTVAAGAAVTLTGISFKALRVSSLGTEAAARTFTATKQFQVGGSATTGSGSVSILGAAGTANALPKWSTGTVLTDSLLTDNGTNVTLGSGNLNLGTNASTLTIGASADTSLARDAANTLALRNGTAAQQFNVYNTYTDASNYERLELSWNVASNVAGIRMAKAGTGSARKLKLFNPDGDVMVDVPINAVGVLGLVVSGTSTSNANNLGRVTVSGQGWTGTSGTHVGLSIDHGAAPTATSTAVIVPLRIDPTINYSNATPGAGSYEALKIAATEIALPTGQNYLIRASAGAAGTTDIFRVTNTGHNIYAQVTTAPTPSASYGGIMGASDIAMFRKADKIVFAYASGNVMTYLTCNLDGSTTTWTHSTATPS